MKNRRVGVSAGWVVAVAALLPALLCSCGGSGGGVQGGAPSGAVSASLVWERPSPGVATRRAARTLALSTDACTEYGIDNVRMTVLNGSQTLATGTFACSAHGGTLNAVPAGSGYTLLFEGLNAGGQAAWTALYNGVSVGGGQTVRYDNVIMRYVGSDRTAPSVLGMTPAEGSQTAPRLDTISIAFDEMLRPSTVNDNTIGLLEFATDNAVSGTVGYDAATFTATFLPTVPLKPLTLYYVKAGKGIMDLAGNHLGSSPPVDNVGADFVSESFLTQAAGPSVTVLPAASVTSAGAVLNGRVNPLGTGTTAYFEYGTDVTFPSWRTLQTANQSLGSGSAPVPISAAVTGLQNNTTYFFRLVANATTSNAWKFTTTSGWTAPALAERLATVRSLYPKIAVDNGGNILNIFVTDPDIADASENSPRLYTNRYFASSGSWSSARNLETDFSKMVPGLDYQLALDAAGNGFAAWRHGMPPYRLPGVSVARFDASTGTWSAPVRLSAGIPNLFRIGTPFLKVTPEGKALLAFEYSDEPNYGYKYTFYEPGTGWLPLSDLIPLAPGNSSILNDLAYDAKNGRFVALWAITSGTVPPDVSVASRNIPLPVGGVIQPMEAPVVIQVDNGVMSGGNGRIGFDNNGWAFAVWAKSYDPGGGGAFVERVYIDQYPGSWSTYIQEIPAIYIGGPVESIRLEVNPSGDAMILLKDFFDFASALEVHTYYYDSSAFVWDFTGYALNGGNPLCSPFPIYGAQTSFAFDENRNGMFVYKASGSGGVNICASRFVRGAGWGTASVLNTADRVDVHYPFVAPTGSGGGFVTIWSQSDGTWEHLFESRFRQ